MKKGRFFQIPERPSDVDLLRQQAIRLDLSTHPSWLDKMDAGYYKYVGNQSTAGLTKRELDQFFEEVNQLEIAGLIVDRDPIDPHLYHLYVCTAADYEIWSIGIYSGRSPLDLHPAPGVKNPVLTRDDVSDAPAVLVADPFMIQSANGWFMFFEVLNWHSNKGEISLATSENGLTWRYYQRVLVEPFHLSYPYVFESDGEYYMIPECRQSGEIRLYKAIEFPTNWAFVSKFLDGDHLVDASVFRKDGRWWMLVGSGLGQRHDTLRLYFAASLTGVWKEHPLSPIVKGDSHIARPGGRVLVEDSRVLRFAQNCRPTYGLDVRAFEIIELTTTSYREIEVRGNPILGPSDSNWNFSGMHHVDALRLGNGSWLACVDGWTAVI